MNIVRAWKSSFVYTFYLLFEIKTEHNDLLQFKTYYPPSVSFISIRMFIFFFDNIGKITYNICILSIIT